MPCGRHALRIFGNIDFISRKTPKILILSAKLNIYTTDKIMKCIADLPMEYFDKSENYDKIQKVNTESNMRSMSIIKTLINLIQGILTMLGTVIILLQVNWIILIILF